MSGLLANVRSTGLCTATKPQLNGQVMGGLCMSNKNKVIFIHSESLLIICRRAKRVETKLRCISNLKTGVFCL